MRKLILGEFVATLITWAIFLAPLAAFGLWLRPLEVRIAAMAISSFVLYGGVLLFRFFVANREWDRSAGVAVIAAFAATIALMGWWGALAVILAFVIWVIRAPKTYPRTLWIQCAVIFASLAWLGTR